MTLAIPRFDDYGYLQAGVHSCTFRELESLLGWNESRRHLLRQLQQSMGLGMLFVTHDLTVASVFCHRLLVLDGGRIVEQGEGAALLANPRAEITRRLVQACPRLPALG
jgi:ABC-type sulfate/molybdate transport systems ATPase subunit